jgi:hypothetical protein
LDRYESCGPLSPEPTGSSSGTVSTRRRLTSVAVQAIVLYAADMSRILVYRVVHPQLSVLRRDTIDGEQGNRGSLTRLGPANGSLIAVELIKLPAVQLTEREGIEATTLSDAATFAISSLFDLMAQDSEGDQWRQDLGMYLQRYASTDAWQTGTLTVDGTDDPAYRLDYRNGRAVIADVGDLFLAVSAYPAPDTIRLERVT